MSPAAEVLVPTSVADAISAFGDGSGITVIGGATIVMPEVNAFRASISKALMLSEAGLAGIRRHGGTVTIGAATTLEALVGNAPDPLSTAAQRVGDYEIRGQATIGGNLCAGPGRETPRGDLQAPLIALAATVRTVGAGGEQVAARRGLPRVRAQRPARSGDRVPRADPGRLRVDGPPARARVHGALCRLRGVRRTASGSRSAAPARSGREPPRSSGRSRTEHLPRTPPPGCSTTSSPRTTPSPRPGTGGRPCRSSSPSPDRPRKGERMKLTVNGVEHELVSPPLRSLLNALRDELDITGPKVGCQGGSCGTCTVLVDGEPRRSCLLPLGSGRRGPGDDHRGPRLPQEPAPDAGCVSLLLRLPVRLLHAGDDPRERGAPAAKPESVQEADPECARRSHVPLHGLREDHRRGRGRGARRELRGSRPDAQSR